MKRSIKFLTLVLLAFTLTTLSFTQSSAQGKVYAKFIIQDARKNDTDISKQWVKEKAYLAIYTTEDEAEDIYFANVNPTQETQSYGAIFDLKVTTDPETEKSYETETFNFKWSYANSYNDKEGTASVKLVKIRKSVGVAFTCTIVTETLDIVVYNGYMEGSLKTLTKP
jgi:hypothetical protein